MQKTAFQKALGNSDAAEEILQRIIETRPANWQDTLAMARLFNGAVYSPSLKSEECKLRYLTSGFVALGARAAMAVNHPFLASSEDQVRSSLLESRIVGGVMHPAVELMRELGKSPAQIREHNVTGIFRLQKAVQDTHEAWQAYDCRMPKSIAAPLTPTLETVRKIGSSITGRSVTALDEIILQSCFPPDGNRPRVTAARPAFA